MQDTCRELDDKQARKRIRKLINTRMQSSQHWLAGESSNSAAINTQSIADAQDKSKETLDNMAGTMEGNDDPVTNERSSDKLPGGKTNGAPMFPAKNKDPTDAADAKQRKDELKPSDIHRKNENTPQRSSTEKLTSSQSIAGAQDNSLQERKTKDAPDHMATATEGSNELATNGRSYDKLPQGNINGALISQEKHEDPTDTAGAKQQKDELKPSDTYQNNENNLQQSYNEKVPQIVQAPIDILDATERKDGPAIDKHIAQTSKPATEKRLSFKPKKLDQSEGQNKKMRRENFLGDTPKAAPSDPLPDGSGNLIELNPDDGWAVACGRRAMTPAKEPRVTHIARSFTGIGVTSESPVSANEILPKTRPFDPSELKAGARVIVIAKDGVSWQATIRKHHERKGEPGFMIHYDGNKKTLSTWVPLAHVVNYIAANG